MSDFERWRIHTARRDYRCDSCSTVLPKGQRYAYGFGVLYGQRSAFRACRPCTKDSKGVRELWAIEAGAKALAERQAEGEG